MSSHKAGQEPKFEEIDEVLSRSELFYERNLKKIITVVIILILIVLSFFAYKFFIAQPKEEKANQSVFMAENSFINNQDSLALYGNGKAALGLKDIEKEYSGTDAANLSYAYSGISLYELGKYDEALAQLKKFESSEHYVGPSILRLMGDCYVQLGENQQAVDAYKKAVSKSQNSAITPSCLLKEGRILETMGKYDEALECYNEIKDKYYTSAESQSVESDIIRCKSKKK